MRVLQIISIDWTIKRWKLCLCGNQQVSTSSAKNESWSELSAEKSKLKLAVVTSQLTSSWSSSHPMRLPNSNAGTRSRSWPTRLRCKKLSAPVLVSRVRPFIALTRHQSALHRLKKHPRLAKGLLSRNSKPKRSPEIIEISRVSKFCRWSTV